MATFQNMGIICINGDIQGVCRNCLWLEWNPELKVCANARTCWCPRREEGEFFSPQAGVGISFA